MDVIVAVVLGPSSMTTTDEAIVVVKAMGAEPEDTSFDGDADAAAEEPVDAA